MTIAISEQGTGPLYTGCLMFNGAELAVAPEAAGAIRVRGRVFDGLGKPIAFPGSLIEFVGAGVFARGQGNAEGDYEVVIKKPAPQSLPDGRQQAPYLDLVVFIHPLLYQFRTRMYFPDESALNAEDPLLLMVPPEARRTLIALPEGGNLRFDFRMQGEGETVFLAPAD